MQLTFGDAEGLGQRKRTRREVFLSEMEQVVPWKALLGLIAPHYPTMGRPGRQPYPLATMLRIHFLQQWYALSDPGMEEALYEIPTLRRFAMKAHIGVDERSGLVHHVACTAANVADVTQVHKLLHGREDTIGGDSGYTGADKREELRHVKAAFRIAEKPSRVRAIRNRRELRQTKRWERYKASVRAKVEHPFRVVKCLFGHWKVRYRGLAKNASQLLTLFALSNLWMARRSLLASAG